MREVRDRLLLPEARSGAEQWQREPMMRSVNAYIDLLDPSTRAAAEISGDTYAGRPWGSYASLDHPPFDICAPVEEQHRAAYDVVICEQVIEHVVDPWGAAKNLLELCAPGGHVIVSTPFLVRVHELPFFGMRDYWRFTPRGLRLLLESAGLEVDRVEAWGNRYCVVGNFDTWPGYRPWMPLRNEPDLPVQVWAFARRPAPAN